MSKDTERSVNTVYTYEPQGKRVLIRKDSDRKQTKGGIVLPESALIQVITGRIVALSAALESSLDCTFRQYDKVLLDPRHAIPVDLEQDNMLFIIPADDIIAVIRKNEECGPK